MIFVKYCAIAQFLLLFEEKVADGDRHVLSKAFSGRRLTDKEI
jgi:hypothetical protein